MASINKRGSSWYYAVSNFVDGKSKPIRKGGFRTKKEAEIAAAELEAKLRKGTVKLTKNISFADYFLNYIEHHKMNLHYTTKNQYLNVQKEISSFFGNIAIQNITRTDYQKFINHYGKERARESVRKANNQIGACVKFAIDDDVILKDFTKNVSLTFTVAAKQEDRKYLNYEDSSKLYKILLDRLEISNLSSYLVLLALVTGMRYGELVGLTDEDFDFEDNTVNIDKQWKYKAGDRKEFGPLKSDAKARRIKVDNVVMEEFKFLITQLPERPHNLIFYSESSESLVISNNAANKTLRRVLNNLNIDYVTLHALRHTNASTMFFKGVSILHVSRRLGHKSVTTTQETYMHILNEMAINDEETASTIYL